MVCNSSSPLAPHSRAAHKGAPRVLAVTHDAARSGTLRGLVRSLAPDARVESETDAIDALMSAARMPADLVLVDAALPHGTASALARHLAGLVPQATVLLIDTPDAPRVQPATLHWADVAPACRDWFAQWQRAAHSDGSCCFAETRP